MVTLGTRKYQVQQDSAVPNSQSRLTAGGLVQLFKLMTVGGAYPQYALVFCKGQNFSDVFLMPFAAYSLMNNFICEWDMEDNFGAGDMVKPPDMNFTNSGGTSLGLSQITNAIVSVATEAEAADAAYQTLKPVRYGDANGRLDFLEFYILNEFNPNTIPNNMGAGQDEKYHTGFQKLPIVTVFESGGNVYVTANINVAKGGAFDPAWVQYGVATLTLSGSGISNQAFQILNDGFDYMTNQRTFNIVVADPDITGTLYVGNGVVDYVFTEEITEIDPETEEPVTVVTDVTDQYNLTIGISYSSLLGENPGRWVLQSWIQNMLYRRIQAATGANLTRLMNSFANSPVGDVVNDAMYDNNGFRIMKDNREVIKGNYNVSLITDSDRFIITNGMFQNYQEEQLDQNNNVVLNPRRREVRIALLSTELNKFENGITSINDVITVSGGTITGIPFMDLTNVASKYSISSVGVTECRFDIASAIFANSTPEQREATKAVAIYDVDDQDSDSGKIKVLIGRNVSNIIPPQGSGIDPDAMPPAYIEGDTVGRLTMSGTVQGVNVRLVLNQPVSQNVTVYYLLQYVGQSAQVFSFNLTPSGGVSYERAHAPATLGVSAFYFTNASGTMNLGNALTIENFGGRNVDLFQFYKFSNWYLSWTPHETFPQQEGREL